MADAVKYIRDNPKTAYEPVDWRLAWVGLVFVGIFSFLVIAPFVLMWAFPKTLSDTDRQLRVEPAAPRLQVDPAADLTRFRAEEERRLNTYYWIDKQKGIVHIPIATAMQKLAKEGIPGFPKGPQK